MASFLRLTVTLWLTFLAFTQAWANPSLPLSKGWEFRWGDDGTGAPPSWALAPVGTTGWQLMPPGNPANPPGRGDSTVLWLRRQLPGGEWTDPGLYIPGADQIFEAYLDGSKIYSFGRKDQAGRIIFPGFPFHNISLPKDYAGKTISLRFFSNHVNIGTTGIPELGSKSETQIAILKRDMERVLMGFVGVMTGLFALFLFLRKRTERTYLTFAGFAIGIGIYQMTRTEMKFFFFSDAVTLFLIELAGFYLAPPCINLFGAYVFGPGPWKLALNGGRFLLGLGTLFLVLAAAGVMSPLSTLLPYQLAFLVTLPFGMVAPMKAAFRRNREGLLFGGGVIVMFLLAAFDVLMAMGVIPRISTAISHWGVFIFLGCLAAILGGRFVQTHAKVARLKTALERILAGTKEMSAVHEKLAAVAKAIHYIQGNISLGNNSHARLTLVTGTESQQICSAVLVSNGKPEASPALEHTNLALLPSDAHRMALSASACFVDADRVLHVPLNWGEKRLGALSLAPYTLPAVDDEEGHFADTLASSLSLTLENIDFLAETAEKARLEGEIHAAEIVQSTLLPRATSVPNVQIESYYKAASSVGGDWYGYHFDEKGRRMFFFIGDVTGHGIPSALLAGVVCGAVYSGEKRIDLAQEEVVVSTEKRLKDMAHTVNDIVFNTGRHADRLMTMLFLALHVDTGELHILNAGHNNPWQLQVQDGIKAKTIVGTGNRLGYTTEFKYSLKKLQLEPNDVVFLYTDGLIENEGPGKELFSLRTLKTVLESESDLGTLKARILQEGEAIWKDAPPADDVTLLLVKWLGNQQETQPS